MGKEFKEMLESYGITSVQEKELYHYFDEARTDIKKGKTITSMSFEQAFYEITDVKHGDFHAAEQFLFECAKEKRYDDLYVHFYKGMAKHDERIREHGFEA